MECRIYYSLCLLVLTAWFVQGENISSPAPLTEDHQCPPWFFYNTTSEKCECYRNSIIDDIVQCAEQGALLRFGYCMTFEEGNRFSVGPCNYFKLSEYNLSTKANYVILPSNASKLNDYMCAPLNRRGVMCSQCMDGYGPSVNSMMYTCKRCSESYWLYFLGYFLLEFGLITAFFFVILFLKLNLTSAPMMTFVLYCQFQGYFYSYITKLYVLNDQITLYWNILMVFYGIFNLDFGRYIIPPFCASPHLKPFHITYIYYIPLIYLLFLMGITCLCINKKPTVFGFKFMNDSKNTMIDVFATFSLLSYAKLMFISMDTALSPVVTWSANNFSIQSSICLFSEPNVEFMERKYLPFIIFSCIVTLFIFIFPIILALYPIEVFRSLLLKYKVISRRMGAINMFLDKFYSCFRDGTNGGRDMRSFVSIYYFVYWLIFGVGIIQELFGVFHLNLSGITFTVFGFLIAIVRPYKTTLMNVSDTLILANLALLFLFITLSVNYYYRFPIYWIIICALNSIPLLVFIVTITVKIFRKFKESSYHYVLIRKLRKSSCCQLKKILTSRSDVGKSETSSLVSNSIGKAPDRVLHPEWYNAENKYSSPEQSQVHSEPQRLDTYCSV